MIHEGTWYWYGEHKTPVGDEARVGVHVYSSKDGINWTDRGVALAVSDDPLSDIRTGCIIERPKVIYNALTKKFVMYAHLERIGEKRYSGMSLVATADEYVARFIIVMPIDPMQECGRSMFVLINKSQLQTCRHYARLPFRK